MGASVEGDESAVLAHDPRCRDASGPMAPVEVKDAAVRKEFLGQFFRSERGKVAFLVEQVALPVRAPHQHRAEGAATTGLKVEEFGRDSESLVIREEKATAPIASNPVEDGRSCPESRRRAKGGGHGTAAREDGRLDACDTSRRGKRLNDLDEIEHGHPEPDDLRAGAVAHQLLWPLIHETTASVIWARPSSL